MDKISNTDLKILHTKTILDNIRKNKHVSRRFLQRASNLSWGTISMTINELIEKNILEEIATNEKNLGRTPKNLQFTKENLIIGIDVSLCGITSIVSDLGCNIVYTTYTELKTPTKQEILDIIFSHVDDMLKKYKIVAVSFSMQGSVDRTSGIALHCYHFKDWKNVNLKQIFHDKYNLNAFVFHDPDCLLAYEKHTNRVLTESIQNAIVIRCDKGIGMAVLMQDNTLIGCHGHANEVGHTIVVPEGKKCRCGKHGCLEAYCSTIAIEEEYQKLTNQNSSIKEIYNLFQSGDAAASQVFSECGKYFAISISNLIMLYDPQIILFGGELCNYQCAFESSMRSILSELHCQIPINFSTYSSISPTIGAILLSIEAISTDMIKELASS